jgi:hypothetical protein
LGQAACKAACSTAALGQASRPRIGMVVRFFGGLAVFGGRFRPKGSDLESGIYTSVFGSSRNRRARWIRIHRCLTFERMGRSPIIFSPIQMSERCCDRSLATTLARRRRSTHGPTHLRRLRAAACKASNMSDKVCHICGEVGHLKRDCVYGLPAGETADSTALVEIYRGCASASELADAAATAAADALAKLEVDRAMRSYGAFPCCTLVVAVDDSFRGKI